MVVVIFLAVFLAVALLLLGLTANSAAEEKQTNVRLKALGKRLAQAEPDAKPMDIRIEQTFSSMPWLDQRLKELDLGPRLRFLLRQADVNWTVGRLLLLCTLCFLGTAYLVWLRTELVFLSVFLGMIAGSFPFLYVFQMRSRRFDRIRSILPDSLDMMVAAIRAGHSFSSALGMASREAPDPLRSELRQCYDEQNYAMDFRQAMMNLERRVPIHDVRVMVSAVLIQKDAGGNLTEILDKVSYLIREDFRLQRQVRVHTAQGRMTGYILALLPAILGLGLYFLNPEDMSLLWKRPIGVKLLYASGISTTVGMIIIRRIVNIRV